MSASSSVVESSVSSGALEGFHPLVRRWFAEKFGAPTRPQADGWPGIHAGEDTLIAAPTGSGKTLAAFLVCLDELVRAGMAGELDEGTRVVYVSPLKALSNDVQRNLIGPLGEIQSLAAREGVSLPEIKVGLRTGDTPAGERRKLIRKPPHILVTTPESLFLMVTAEKSRETLRGVRTVIIDEIHALARDKRGSHLTLTLERLDALVRRDVSHARPLRIGLSATQKPIERIARFLTGTGRSADAPCRIVDGGHARDLDLGVEVPSRELSAVCSNEHWDEIYERIVELIQTHRSTVIFVNTRSMAERVSFALTLELGEDAVTSHHGSLSRDIRLRAEQRLKNGELKAIVATASLELGIDIGYIDLVIQIGSPRSIAAFLQRVGRSGHNLGALPKGRLFALTRDELVESLSLMNAVREGLLDPVEVPPAPLDILAQQLIALAACDEWSEEELYTLVRRAAPYNELARSDFDDVLRMLTDGYGDKRSKSYVHHDRVNGLVRGRTAGRLAALTSGGAIPEQPAYRVVNIDDGAFVGTIHEDFAVERPAGTIFLLGNNSWQMVHTRGLVVSVRDAKGAPPSMPFWFGEAPGRTFELSGVVSELRAGAGDRLSLSENELFQAPKTVSEMQGRELPAYRAAREYLHERTGIPIGRSPVMDWGVLQAVHYIAVQKAALGLVPSRRQIVFERFFDDTGGMQLVIHAPFGMRVNRGWGLALRKSFCRSFDFELQASADDDGIVLSLGENQSFPIEQLFRFVTPQNVRALLEQAFLQVPFFRTRWQWNTNRALAVLRTRAGKRVAPALQRMRGDDLLTAVFPASTQCLEHVTGDIELPDHPLIKETMRDCLDEAADLERLGGVLAEIQTGSVELIARDTREPSPFAYERLNASPYAFLDGAGLLDRRAQALSQRRTLPIDEMRDLARLDEAAIERVAREAWPLARNPDELHDVLYGFGVLPARDGERSDWRAWFDELVMKGRAGLCRAGEREFWFAAERLSLVRAAYPDAEIQPEIRELPERYRDEWDSIAARELILSARLDVVPILTAPQLAFEFGFAPNMVRAQLEALEAQGGILRGRFRGAPAPSAAEVAGETGEISLPVRDEDAELQWCNRRLLQRIHRLTLEGLRNQIRPVSVQDYTRFLFEHHRLAPGSRREGRAGLADALLQLEGFEAAAGQWEAGILPARVADYQPAQLDELSRSGEWTYGRLRPPVRDEADGPLRTTMSRVVPIAFVLRESLEWIFTEAVAAGRTPEKLPPLSEGAEIVFRALVDFGAQFPAELAARSRLDAAGLDEALGELVRVGLITADGFAAVRAYVAPEFKKRDRLRRAPGRFPRRAGGAGSPAGRWALFPGNVAGVSPSLAAVSGTETFVKAEAAERADRTVEGWAWLLLERYGVLFYDILARETAAPPWSALRPVLRKLEAQGRIRGGRFIVNVAAGNAGAGALDVPPVSGEQFALPDVIDRLRAARDAEPTGDCIVLAAADPLNLVGVLHPGERIAGGRNVRLVFQDGRHVATRDGEHTEFHGELAPAAIEAICQALDAPRSPLNVL